jgi:transitional endoplasmic reticulum ATPase
MTGFHEQSDNSRTYDHTSQEFYHNASAQRVNTDAVIVSSLRQQYPKLQITVSPTYPSNLLAYAAAGFATAKSLQEDPRDPFSGTLTWRQYMPPARRGDAGVLFNRIQFGKYEYTYKDATFILYIVSGRDGGQPYPQVINNYIVSAEQHKVDELLLNCASWGTKLHNEVWVFDGGYWSKNAALWQSIQHSEWRNVILPEEMKQAIINDVENFFDSESVYKKLQVPWKRGIIYHGPPGNGKTISIKAMMHQLYQRKDPIPTLYVRSLSSYGGPEYALGEIFGKARQEAPCYLVFEDLDSIVTDNVRSYFLNEVDGLKDNDGILIVGSTNHLDRLDDGIAKRPSRFDRKYLFPNPKFEDRTAYAKFWQKKLSSNPEIEFPDKLCPAVAKITDKFSFAYMQEAFVAALLVIASRGGLNNRGDKVLDDLYQRESSEDDDLKDLPLWQELKKQIAILREGIDDSDKTSHEKGNAPSPGRVHNQNRSDVGGSVLTEAMARSEATSSPIIEFARCLLETLNNQEMT